MAQMTLLVLVITLCMTFGEAQRLNIEDQRKESTFLHHSGPLLENGLDRPEIALVDMALLVSPSFPIYLGVDGQNLPLKIFAFSLRVVIDSCQFPGRGIHGVTPVWRKLFRKL